MITTKSRVAKNITSNTTSMPEIAGDAAVVIDPNNVAQITQQIQTLINNETLRQELSQKGLKRSLCNTLQSSIQIHL